MSDQPAHGRGCRRTYPRHTVLPRMPPKPFSSSLSRSDGSRRVAFVMTGDLYRNSRAIKQIRSLQGSGYVVDVWHLESASERISLPDSVTVHPLTRPSGRGPFFFRQVDRMFASELSTVDADVFHASDLYALAACRRRADQSEAALTYDAREYYPHVAGTVGKPWARLWWRQRERKHIGRADAVFTVSDSIADALVADYGIVRPSVVHNAPSASANTLPADFQTLSERIGTTDPIILHLGQMKAHRGCASLITAMLQVKRAHLVFLGYGSERPKLESLTKATDLTARVHFLDPVSPDAIRATIQDARIGVTMLEDTCLNHRFALPNKLFDYVHAGIPVLGADLDEVSRVISTFDIGMTASPESPESIADALHAMLDPAKQSRWRGRLPQAAETFTWESASQRLLAGVDHAIQRSARTNKDLPT